MKSMTTTARKNRSALRDKPLRDPGQSLREEVEDVVLDEGIYPVMCVTIAGFYAIYEWWRWFTNWPPHPIIVTVIAVTVAIWAGMKMRAAKSKVERLRKGIAGERHSAQFLQNELLPLGYRLIHDLCEDGYNIDHALIGPKGVFALETKAFSKSDTADQRITYDGEQLRINGFVPDRNPIVQAEAAAKRLTDILFSYSGMQVKVQPVVLIAGWRVERTGRGTTWVVNFAGLLSFLEHENDRLQPADIERFYEALTQYQRMQEKLKA